MAKSITPRGIAAPDFSVIGRPVTQRIRSDPKQHFTGVLAQCSSELENLAGLISNRILIKDIIISSQQPLRYQILLFSKDGFTNSDLDADSLVAELQANLPTYGGLVSSAISTVREDTDINSQIYGSGRTICKDSTGRLWTAAQDYTTNEFYVLYSDDQGSTWTVDKVLARQTAYGAGGTAHSLAIDSEDNLHVVYESRITGAPSNEWHVYYRKRTASTGEWSAPVDLDTSDSYGYDHAAINVLVDGEDNIHVLWVSRNITGVGGGDTTYAVLYRRYNSQSSSWGGIEEVSYISGSDALGCVGAIFGGVVHCAFVTAGVGTFPARRQVCYKKRNGAWGWGITPTYESSTDDDDTGAAIYGAYYPGQTFTPSWAHSINQVRIKVYKDGNPGTITVSIRATSGGLPTGADLATGTFDGNTIGEGLPNVDWVTVTLTSLALSADTKYAIVVKAPTGDINNSLVWMWNFPSVYSGGNGVYSNDSGVNWGSYLNYDFTFELSGPTGTLIQITDVNYNQGLASLVVDSSGNVAILWEGAGYGDNLTINNIHFIRIVGGSLQTRENITDSASQQNPFNSGWGWGLTLAIDQQDEYHALWAGQGWGNNPTIHSVQYRKRDSSGNWQSQVDLVNEAQAQIPWSALWARYPSHQVLVGGYIFTFESYKTGVDSDLEVSGQLLTTPGFYSLSFHGLYIPYEDLDATNELHLALHNLSPTSKQSGSNGQVVIEFIYEPVA